MATLIDRILLGLRAVVNDAVDDITGDSRPVEATPREVERLLARAEKRLAQVERDQAAAVAREKRAAAELAEAQAQMDALDREVDDALRANNQDLARTRLDLLRQLRIESAEKEKQLRIHATVGARLQQEADDLRAQLGVIRAQLKGLAEPSTHRQEEGARAQATAAQQATAAATAEPKAAAQVAAPAAPPAAEPTSAPAMAEEGLDDTRIADALQRMRQQESGGGQ